MYRWTDGAESHVTCEFLGGKLVQWQMGAIQTDVTRRSSGAFQIAGPILVPLSIGAIQAQGQHVLGVGCPPPSAWAL